MPSPSLPDDAALAAAVEADRIDDASAHWSRPSSGPPSWNLFAMNGSATWNAGKGRS